MDLKRCYYVAEKAMKVSTSEECISNKSDKLGRLRYRFTKKYADFRRRCLSMIVTLMLIVVPETSQQQLLPTNNLQPPPAVIPMQQQIILAARSNVGSKAAISSSARDQPTNVPPQSFSPLLSVSQGPGIDLVALNWRRFELSHRHHKAQSNAGEDLKRGELIESQLAAIPDTILSQLPDELNKQIVESLAADPSLVLASRDDLLDLPGPEGAAHQSEDPDGASIERLTKSCLTVQASSLTPNQLNVTFHLYTRRNPNQSFIVRPQAERNEIVHNSPFDARKPIKWITHGFHTNLDKSEWMLETKDKILAHEDANVFLTDWRRGASPALAFYPKAAANAHVVARMIVKILRRLWADIDLSKVHLIGHSLGAHIMGFVGSSFTEEFLHKQQQVLATKGGEQSRASGDDPLVVTSDSINNQLIGRITACDPALPCFGPTSQAPNSKMSGTLTMEEIKSAKFKSLASGWNQEFGFNQRLKRQAQQQQIGSNGPMSGNLDEEWTPTMWTHLRPDSAILVEVMHSNPGFMGYAEPLGDFDFYPNGSERQPGCGNVGPNEETGATQSKFRNLMGEIGGLETSGSNNVIKKRQLGLIGSIIQRVANRNQKQSPPETTNAVQASSVYSDITKSLAQFMKPIRDFFQAYTCSHHRSVEYMVESMYYDKMVPSERLNRVHVCQIVGYRCSDYQTFKRGHCFLCRNELECRSLAMSTPTFSLSSSSNLELMSHKSLATHFPREDLAIPANQIQNDQGFTTNGQQVENLLRHKRILPTLNQYRQDYKPTKYYFDTKPTRNYCLHHYHILVKYRWFRIRESVTIDSLRLGGAMGDLLVQRPTTFNKFTHHSYTMLLTHEQFLGQIETLTLYGADGDRLKPQYIEYIDVTYMSNIDPLVRAANSARMCRTSQQQQTQMNQEGIQRWTRCSGNNLLVR